MSDIDKLENEIVDLKISLEKLDYYYINLVNDKVNIISDLEKKLTKIHTDYSELLDLKINSFFFNRLKNWIKNLIPYKKDGFDFNQRYKESLINFKKGNSVFIINHEVVGKYSYINGLKWDDDTGFVMCAYRRIDGYRNSSLNLKDVSHLIKKTVEFEYKLYLDDQKTRSLAEKNKTDIKTFQIK